MTIDSTFNYTYDDFKRVTDTAPSVADQWVDDMGAVADACTLDAKASAEDSISSLLKPYHLVATPPRPKVKPEDVPYVARQPGEPPFAFALPDDGMQGHVGDLHIDTKTGMPSVVDGEESVTQQLADLIIKLKRAGRDQEAIELLLGAGGRVVEGFVDKMSAPNSPKDRMSYMTYSSTDSWR
jgi:hypothetical protein